MQDSIQGIQTREDSLIITVGRLSVRRRRRAVASATPAGVQFLVIFISSIEWAPVKYLHTAAGEFAYMSTERPGLLTYMTRRSRGSIYHRTGTRSQRQVPTRVLSRTNAHQ